MKLFTPYGILDVGRTVFVSIVDRDGMWVFDCYRQDAKEIVKRINTQKQEQQNETKTNNI